MNAEKGLNAASLEAMVELARTPSEANRTRLIEGLTDHFIGEDSAQNENCRVLFGEVVCRLLDRLQVESRANISEKLASLAEIPRAVIRQLAADTIDVAAAVLEKSPVLTDSDLIAIATEMVSEHRLAISRRENLKARVTSTLIESNEVEVNRQLAGNATARFSPTTFRALAEKAKTDQVLLERLVEREDLTPAVTVQISPFMSEEMKAKFEKSAESSGFSLLDSLDEVTAAASVKKSASDAGPDIDALLAQIGAGEAALSRVLEDMADQENFPGIVRILAAMAKLPAKTIRTMLLNIDGTPISVICKALEIDRFAFEAISHLRCEEMNMPHGDMITQTKSYADINPTDARKTLQSLSLRVSGSKAA